MRWEKSLLVLSKYFVEYGEINIYLSQIGLIWRKFYLVQPWTIWLNWWAIWIWKFDFFSLDVFSFYVIYA